MLDIEQTFELVRDLFAADGGAGVGQLLQLAGTQEVHPLLQRLGPILQPYAKSTAELAGLLVQWDLFRSAMTAFLGRHDVILAPVVAAQS